MLVGTERDNIEKEVFYAQRVIDIIDNVTTPMLIYDEEKDIVRKALIKYKDELESRIRGY